MKIVVKWQNGWLRTIVYALLSIALIVAGLAKFKFVYQGF